MHGETITLLLLVVIGFTTWQGLHQPGVMEKYLFSTEAFRLRKEWIRLISPAFLHAGWGHFFGNALTLFFFGRFLENSHGPGFLLGIFLGSVAGGHLLCLWLHPQSDYRAIGASGGALGVLFAGILMNPKLPIFLFPLPLPIPGWIYAMAYLLYTLSSLRGSSRVSHEAHLGGMLSGVMLTLIRFPKLLLESPLLVTAILLLAGGSLWYVHANPGRIPGFLGFQFRQKVQQHKHKQQRSEAKDVDALLDKVSEKGLHSLTKRERKLLEEASRRRRDRT